MDNQKYIYNEARLEVLKALKAAIGKSYAPTYEELELPPKPEYGDVAYPCFALAKGMGKNPAELATELAAKIGPKGVIGAVTSMGPYVNFVFNKDEFARRVVGQILAMKDAYGRSEIGEGRQVMVEYVNFNTHKEVHIGHVRNMIVGHLAINLLRVTGHKVIAASYINDMGANVAKCLWAMKKFHEHEEPEKGDEINFLGRLYTEATKAAEDDEEARKEISEIQHALEERKGEWHKLWKKTRQWSIDAMYAIFKEMRLPLEKQYYESEVLDDAREIVEELEEKGIAVESEGALIVDLDDQGLGVNLLVKSDGALLYNAKDLGLAKRKAEDYDLDRSILVIDERQSLAMKQLFATLKLMGEEIPYEHLAYAFVTLPEGAMSSRKGNFVRYEELRDTLRESAEKETRERHTDWSQKQVDETVSAIAHSAMVYAMAKQDAKKDIVFNIDDAMAFDGMSGPYLLYSVSRIESVLGKTKVKPDVESLKIETSQARAVVSELARFPDVVLDGATNMNLSVVGQYAFDLAQAFSSYYGAERIIDEEDKDATAGRLALASAVLTTLKSALAIMNIQPLKEM